MVLLDFPSSHKGIRMEFTFVYFGVEWDIGVVRSDVEPNFNLDYRVPNLVEEEGVAACYMQME